MKNLEQQLPNTVKFLLVLAIALFLSTRMLANSIYPSSDLYSLNDIILNVENIDADSDSNSDEDEEEEDDEAALLEQAMFLFECQKWERAKYSFYKYLESHNDGSELHLTAVYYHAKSAFNAGNYHRAVEGFSEYLYLQKQPCPRIHDIEWDLAIATLEIDKEKSKIYLKDMAGNNGHKFQDEAKGLLSIL